MINLALYHPQIPQNTGTLLRLTSCLGIHLDIIRPLGFIFDDKRLRRAGMDYISISDYEIHNSFDDFCEKYKNRRIVALEISYEAVPHQRFQYISDDILVVGSEHYGFIKDDLKHFSNFVKIPMIPGRRSINMAIAAGIVVSEAMSQLDLWN